MNAWITTDEHGRIEIASRDARRLFGGDFARGSEIVERLTLPRRAALRDIELALCGWPAERTIVVDVSGCRALNLRYRISRQIALFADGLFWQFEPHRAVQCRPGD